MLSLPLQAADKLDWFTGFGAVRSSSPEARVLVLLFSQPDCGYCDLVRNEFLMPLSRQNRAELAIREIKVPSFDTVLSRENQPLSPRAFASRYAINFYPSVLMLDLNGNALGTPLVGISSRDFYGFYLDQAIDQALSATAPLN